MEQLREWFDENQEKFCSAVIVSIFLICFLGAPVLSPQSRAGLNQRNIAPEALGSMDPAELDDRSLAVVLRLTNDNEQQLRAAIHEAGKRDSALLTKRLAMLTPHKKDLVRIDLIKALSQPQHFERSTAFVAIAKLVVDQDYLVRGHAAKTLSASDNTSAQLILAKQLAREDNKVVFQILLRSLDRRV